MAKYSYDFKKQVVEEYLRGEGGYGYLANKYGISDKKMIRLWVNNYEAQQMKYMGWNDIDDSYYILLISTKSESPMDDFLVLLMNHLFKLFNNCAFFIHKHGVVVIVNKKDMTDNFINDIKKIVKNRNYIIGKSLPFQNIRNSKYFYDQVKFVIDRNMDSSDIVKEGKIIDFYDYAIEYIIRNSDENAAFFACNPDIVKLWYMDKINNLDRLKTFSVYLNNDRSLLYAAQELYVHRNTLVYRINKILEELSGDLDDVYTRDYMKLSIRILNIYDFSGK